MKRYRLYSKWIIGFLCLIRKIINIKQKYKYKLLY